MLGAGCSIEQCVDLVKGGGAAGRVDADLGVQLLVREGQLDCLLDLLRPSA